MVLHNTEFAHRLKTHETTMRVLIADSNPFIIRMFQFVFKILPEFSLVGITRSGMSTLQQAQELQPDVILLDINFKNVSQLIEYLSQVSPHTHIYVLTNMYTPPVFIQLALEVGAVGTISKVDTLHNLTHTLQIIERKVT